MVDCCLTRLCDMCGKRIQGGYGHCPKCNICICFNCEIEQVLKGEYPVKCPMCEAKLQD